MEFLIIQNGNLAVLQDIRDMRRKDVPGRLVCTARTRAPNRCTVLAEQRCRVELRISPRALQDRHGSNGRRPSDIVRETCSRSVDLIDRLSAELLEQLHALRDTGRARWMPLRVQTAAGIDRQRPTDLGDSRLEQLETLEAFGESEILVADDLDSGEVVVDLATSMSPGDRPAMPNACFAARRSPRKR